MPNAPARFERIAHRGAPREFRENTIAAFQRALERGADSIELDAHATKDGVIVVHHDDRIRDQAIAELDWAELSAIDLGAGDAVPRLDDSLRAIGDRARVYIELKAPHIEQATLAVARTHGRRYLFHSFHVDAIARLARLAPDVPRGVLIERDVPDPIRLLGDAVSRTRPRDVWPHWTLVNQEFMLAASDLAVRVVTWTVNSPETAAQLLRLGVEGLCTDDVRLLADL
jgi:glycerophosphoryl diester phosphodiesterase